MHSPKRRKLVSSSELQDLVKNSKNGELHRFLQYTKPSDWVLDDGSTLLHCTIVYNNHKMLKYLLDTGNDVNAKDSSDDTPLLTALKLNNYEAVNILLDADADISVIDQSTKKIVLSIMAERMKEGVKDFIPNLISNLKRKKLDTESLVKLLTDAKYPFKYVMFMNDYDLSREFLIHNREADFTVGMGLAMDQQDLKHVELIFRHGDSIARSYFHGRLYHFFAQKQIGLWQLFLECLIHWEFLCIVAVKNLHFMFYEANMEQLQILFDLQIDVIVKEKFGVDLRISVFGNRNVDANKCLCNRNFNFNVPGIYDAFSYAIVENLPSNVRFLLDSGADINCRSDLGMTPLFYSLSNPKEIECGRLLLEYGADIQTLNPSKKKTTIEFARERDNPLLEFLIARLAFDHVHGVPIQKAYQEQIDSESDHRTIYDACCQQLEALKTREIVKSVTFYAVLTEKLEILCRFLSNHDTVSLLDEYEDQFELNLLYYFMLKHKLVKASNLYRFKCDLANVMTENTGQTVDFDNIAIRNISKHLTQWDIEQFSKSCRTS